MRETNFPMKTFRTSLSIILALGLLASCQKEETQELGSTAYNIVSSTKDLQVPQSFNFATTTAVNIDLNIDQAPQNGKYLLKVYAERPSAATSPVYQAFMSSGNRLQEKVTIPAGLQQIYLVMQAPDGSSFLTILPNSQTIRHTFYQGKMANAGKAATTPDCTSGCDQTTTHSGWWNADDKDDVYCVTGTYNGGGFNIKKGAIVRLCGTGSISNVNVEDGQLQIIAGADVTITNLNLNSSNGNKVVVYQGASLTLTNWFSPNADIVNYGTIDAAALNVNSNSEIENHGDFTVSGGNYTTFNGDVDNYGTFTVVGNTSVNSSSKIKNYCGLYFNGDVQLNGDIDNRSYTKITSKLTINSSGRFKMKDGAMGVCEDLWLNGNIEGDGSTSLFKVLDRSDANTSGRIKDNLEFCDANGIENIPNGAWKGGAVASCSLVIPSDACNPEGNGQPQIQDADGDGVADNIDAYPNDASRASDSYFPSENTYGTLAFEDLWPAYGDYDFNDLVVDYRYQQVLNASNEVVDLKARFVTRAIGGTFQNGFGIQLGLAQSAVASVSGTQYFGNAVSTNANGTESGQTNAVVIVYDDATQVLVNNTGQAFVNTVSGNTAVDADTADITINFSSPQTIASLGTAPYNPFIFIDQNRGKEVHLAGEEPTDLADANLFGTLDDATDLNSSIRYKSAEGLPFAIHVVGGFSYPEERVDIAQAYNYFSVWAQSGGLSYTSWYEDQPGYINVADLFQ